jgi:amino acid adenylation domain-containing protein
VKPIGQLMAELRRARVQVWDDGEQLRYKADRGALTPALLAELRERKADLLAFCRRARDGAGALPLGPIARDGELPASPAQRRLWLLDQLQGPGPAYNIAMALRLRGPLDVPALEHGLAAIVRRHESLRTSFRARGDDVVQVIAPPSPPPLTIADLRGLDEDRRTAEACLQARADALRPFDLGRGPLARFVLWALGDRDHVLLVNLHHIVADGRSVHVLLAELAEFYASRRAGRDADVPELPVQYADFAHHQRLWLGDPALAEQLDYWKRQLSGLPPLLELPADRPRPPGYTSDGAIVPSTLDAALVGRLRGLAQRSGATPFVALLAAAAALVARHTGRVDIPIGCPVTNRDRPELEPLIGFFVNTLVLRIDLAGDPSFRELIARAHAVVTDGFARRDVPFDRVVEAAAVGRDPSYPPLVQFTVMMLDGEKNRLELPGLEAETFDFGNPIARTDLSIEIYDYRDRMDLFWIYNTNLFDEATVARMARHLETLLAAATSDPDRPIAALPLLDEQERRTILEDWNDTRAGDPAGDAIIPLFEAQARRTPDAVAVAAEGRRWSYAELNARANRLARHLVARGVGPDVLVGLCVERSLAMVVGLLGVLKAGGAYVPLEPDYPRDRLAFMWEDAGSPLLLTQTSLRERLPATARAILLDADGPEIDRLGSDDLAPHELATPPAPDHLAYVIYTSGSTGKPKGVMISRRALSNHMAWMRRTLPLSAADNVLQKTPFSFDASVWEFYAPLLAGATLTMARPGGHPDPAYLVRTVREERITVLQVVPTLLRHLLLEEALGGCTGLTRLFAGGEALTREDVRAVAARLPGVELHNLYGPTEATIDATSWRCRADDPARGLPYGGPIDNLRAYVLDRGLRPTPIGVPGELYLGGVGLARGYLGRPDLTAERFVPDPFGATPGGRLYRTGDLARHRPDGVIEYLGRLDHQVKVGGCRIELAEVESALAAHPAVRRCLVLDRDDAQGGARLVAYVVPATPGAPPGGQDLRHHLARTLPDYMLPRAFVVLDAFPVTPNGKIDREALRRLGPGDADAADASEPPRTEVERRLAGLWAEVLGVPRVGRADAFFAIGGDSFAAVRLVSRVRHTFGVDLPMRVLFEQGTVAGMAAALAEDAVRVEAAARLRDQIDRMSPAEIRALLEQKRSGASAVASPS